MAVINQKSFLCVLLLLLQTICSGQPAVWEKLHQADSLLLIEKSADADSILKLAEAIDPTDVQIKLELQYLRGFYYNNVEELIIAANTLVGLAEKAIGKKQYNLAAKTYILEALIFEKAFVLPACRQKLDEALSLLKKHGIHSLYGWYYVRLSSYYRFSKQYDSGILAARQAIPYAEKFKQQRILTDGYLLNGILSNKIKPGQGIPWIKLALHSFLQQKNYVGAVGQYANLSWLYLKEDSIKTALAYNDSALWLAAHSLAYDISIWKYRSQIYEYTGQYDSALHYYKQFTDGRMATYEKKEEEEIKKITAQYETSKKEATIREQRSSLKAVIAIALITGIALVILYFQNQKIIRKNKRINSQVEELNKLVQQKQILLSELQHRVKNNLQHVLSLMDIQKESLGHNNIDEVIRENQNRVHSMALLHSKLSFANGDAVNFEEYLHEMTSLMKTAYYDPKKDISVQIICSVKELDIDTAIPLGLVLVELLSNSLKHAFKNRTTGSIEIEVSEHAATGKNQMVFKDTGIGFDFNESRKKGLGIELIHGLLREINATLQIIHDNGTTFSILF